MNLDAYKKRLEGRNTAEAMERDTTKLVKDILKNHGFMKVIINAPIMFEDTDYYQITMQYVKSKAI